MRAMRNFVVWNVPETVAAIMKAKGIRVKTDTMDYVQVEKTQDKAGCFVELLKEHGIEWKENEETVLYDRGDIEASECAVLNIQVNDFWGLVKPENFQQNDSFDSSSICPLCGNGLIQRGPLALSYNKPRSSRKKIRQPMNYYVMLVDRELRNSMEAAGFNGFDFWPVKHHGNDDIIDDIYQIYITNTLPPIMDPRNLFLPPAQDRTTKVCSCGKTLYTLQGDSVHYPNDVQNYLKDINRSGEWFFEAGGVFIVSRRFALFLIDNGIKNVFFTPIATT